MKVSARLLDVTWLECATPLIAVRCVILSFFVAYPDHCTAHDNINRKMFREAWRVLADFVSENIFRDHDCLWNFEEYFNFIYEHIFW